MSSPSENGFCRKAVPELRIPAMLESAYPDMKSTWSSGIRWVNVLAAVVPLIFGDEIFVSSRLILCGYSRAT